MQKWSSFNTSKTLPSLENSPIHKQYKQGNLQPYEGQGGGGWTQGKPPWNAQIHIFLKKQLKSYFYDMNPSHHSVKNWGLVATIVPSINPAGLEVDEVADMNTSAIDLHILMTSKIIIITCEMGCLKRWSFIEMLILKRILRHHDSASGPRTKSKKGDRVILERLSPVMPIASDLEKLPRKWLCSTFSVAIFGYVHPLRVGF